MIKRFYVEKKAGFNTKSKALQMTFRKILNLKALEGLRIVNRYDIEALPEDVMQQVVDTIFSEPNVDNVYVEDLPVSDDEKVFAIEYLPGQYDQQADFAVQCVQLLSGTRPTIKVAECIVLKGDLSDEDISGTAYDSDRCSEGTCACFDDRGFYCKNQRRTCSV